MSQDNEKELFEVKVDGGNVSYKIKPVTRQQLFSEKYLKNLFDRITKHIGTNQRKYKHGKWEYKIEVGDEESKEILEEYKEDYLNYIPSEKVLIGSAISGGIVGYLISRLLNHEPVGSVVLGAIAGQIFFPEIYKLFVRKRRKSIIRDVKIEVSQ